MITRSALGVIVTLAILYILFALFSVAIDPRIMTVGIVVVVVMLIFVIYDFITGRDRE